MGGVFAKNVPVDLTPVSATTDTAFPLHFSISPALPAGLTLHPQTCRITGVPTAAGAISGYTISADEISTAQYNFTDNVAADVTSYNLRTRAMAAGWNGTQPLKAVVTIQGNVTVRGTTSVPAWTTGSIPAGSDITLNLQGTIVGADATTGNNGGHGMVLTYPVKITMSSPNSLIAGGNGKNWSTLAIEKGTPAIEGWGNDVDGAAGDAIQGGALITWNSATVQLHRICGKVDHWGFAAAAINGSANLRFMGVNTSPVQLTWRTSEVPWTTTVPDDWYWRNYTAAKASPGVPTENLRLRAPFINAGSSPLSVHIYGACDDELIAVKVNNADVTFTTRLSYWEAGQTASFDLPVGLSIVEVTVANYNYTKAGESLVLRNSAQTVLIPRNMWKIAS